MAVHHWQPEHVGGAVTEAASTEYLNSTGSTGADFPKRIYIRWSAIELALRCATLFGGALELHSHCPAPLPLLRRLRY